LEQPFKIRKMNAATMVARQSKKNVAAGAATLLIVNV
jgi:hypothetical protein